MSYDTPEEAALSSWRDHPRAGARVVAVTRRGERAEVVLEVGPGYRLWAYCRRGVGGWIERSTGNGPTTRWDDPSFIP